MLCGGGWLALESIKRFQLDGDAGKARGVSALEKKMKSKLIMEGQEIELSQRHRRHLCLLAASGGRVPLAYRRE